MARITSEDCLKVVPNRFKLIVLAAQRAHAILSGSKARISRDDREIVLALREIAESKIDIDELWNAVINKYRKDTVNDNSFSTIDAQSHQLFSIADFDLNIGDDIFDATPTSDDKNSEGNESKVFEGLNLDVED